MKKLHTNKGFTMAELLIVVAIIAILVAIAIPTFKDQLERAREGVDLSELRNGYSQATAKFMTTKDPQYEHTMKFKQATSGWTIDVTEFPIDISSIMTSGTLTLPSTGEISVYFTRTETVPGVWDSGITASLSATPAAASPLDADNSKIIVANLTADNVGTYFDVIAINTAVTASEKCVKKESDGSFSIVESNVDAASNTVANTYYKLNSTYATDYDLQ